MPHAKYFLSQTQYNGRSVFDRDSAALMSVKHETLRLPKRLMLRCLSKASTYEHMSDQQLDIYTMM